MNKWNNKFRYQVASCWLFILRIGTIVGRGPSKIFEHNLDIYGSSAERPYILARLFLIHLLSDLKIWYVMQWDGDESLENQALQHV